MPRDPFPAELLENRYDDSGQCEEWDRQGPGAARPAAAVPRPKERALPREQPLSRPNHGLRRPPARWISEQDLATLTDVGMFRVLDGDDLATYRYSGSVDRMIEAVRRLSSVGWIRQERLPNGRGGFRRLIGLTKQGRRVVRGARRLPPGQEIHYGLVRAREARHDTGLYPLYQEQAARIEEAGGRLLRVRLGAELGRALYRDLARLGRLGDKGWVRDRIAESHGLAVVDGAVRIPDLRLEYETAEREPKHVDLELVTRAYRGSSLSQKARAGMALFARREDASEVHRALGGTAAARLGLL